MPYSSLSEFLAELEDANELARISVPVDSALELAAITDHAVKSSTGGGPALLFENVTNNSIPVVTNLLGSVRRVCRILRVPDLNDIGPNLERKLQSDHATGWLGSLILGPGSSGLGRWGPKSIKTGSCQQVVKLGRDVNLWDLPIPRCWPEEQFPILTAGQIVTRDCMTGRAVNFQSPLVVAGQQELGWYVCNHQQREILRIATEAKQNLPVSISLGGDPILQLTMALPELGNARSLSGLLRGANLEVVRCRTNELEVPAQAEIVIEGYIDAANPISAVPLTVSRGNGRYIQCELPLIRVGAITHRANPVLPAMVVSGPPSEESWISLARDRMLLPILKRTIPEIVDIHQPFSSANRNLLFVSIQKSADHEARRILHALWGLESTGQTKIIIIVDSDQDLRQEDEVWFRVGTHACPNRDFMFADGLARDDDYTALSTSLAGRVGIDATRKRNNEQSTPWPKSLIMSDEVLARVRDRWSEFGIKSGQQEIEPQRHRGTENAKGKKESN